MVAVPTAGQEDARRVTRERKGVVREQTKLINRLKAMFACLGIQDFKPYLKGNCKSLSFEIVGTYLLLQWRDRIWVMTSARNTAHTIACNFQGIPTST